MYCLKKGDVPFVPLLSFEGDPGYWGSMSRGLMFWSPLYNTLIYKYV